MDEDIRRALEESIRTAEQEREVSAANADTAPSAPMLHPTADPGPEQSTGSNWEQQRLEALAMQRRRWEQLHGHQESSENVDVAQQTHYPHVPSGSAPPAYPSIPSPGWGSAPHAAGEQQHAAEFYAEQRRRQQEEEDHRLAMQLAEAFAEEDAAEELAAANSSEAAAAAARYSSGAGSASGADDDWQQVHRSASMQAATAGGSSDDGSSSTRPTSHAAAAAGSTAGGLVGAGLAALLAMAANAVTGSREQEASAHATAGSSSSSSSSRPGAAAADAGPGHTGSSSGNGSSSQTPSLWRMAASALVNYLAGNTTNSSSSSTATASTSTAAGSSSSSGHRQQQPSDNDMVALEQLMQQFMLGRGPAAAAHGSTGGSSGGARGSGFRVVHLPGGGFAATYSSSSSSRSQQHARDPRDNIFAEDDPFGFGSGGNDLFTQLLLAGARSAASNAQQQEQRFNRDPTAAAAAGGFQHFNPATGSSSFEPGFGALGPQVVGLGPEGRPLGLEALFEALMGHGVLGGMTGGEGGGNLSYEDLVGLENVAVRTPEDVLQQLPRSTYVEGRKPGDSDTCVICQTPYAVGDALLHLPCLHAFHQDCITPWLQSHSTKCPVCKTDVC